MLLTPEELDLEDRLQSHLEELTSFSQRNVWSYDELRAAAEYIEHTFRENGWTVSQQNYEVVDIKVSNIIAEIKGTSAPEEIIVIGAHYDSVFGSPGADDNASGVAALLELSRILLKQNASRTIRLVAFVNEEAPFFFTKYMGSLRYAKTLREQNENVLGMISLDCLGYYSQEKKSQKFPVQFFRFLYPDRGNFIGFVSNFASHRLLRKSLRSFRQYTGFPAKALVAPRWITGVSLSDHLSFWLQDYPAILVTDTALFRNPNYHTEMDTKDKIDYNSMSRVVAGLAHTISVLATK